ncbi:SdrD B-like domain-containing protein [Kitasatospora sp. NPDC101801]|uniref:SdrD B-like domain-containing protein n=1 Tax=Kitasatospora sp. NPDC101801 TaxID=3364103 RepID=UPI003812206B
MSNTRRARGRVRAGTLVAVLATTGTLLVPMAAAAPGDGTITVTVIHDTDSSGTFRSGKPGVAGQTITVTDDTNTKVTGTTGADGVATFDASALASLTTGKYRVEMLQPAAPWWYGPAYGPRKKPVPSEEPDGDQTGTPLSSSVEFVDVSGGKNASLTIGVVDPTGSAPNPDVLKRAKAIAAPIYLGATVSSSPGVPSPTAPALITWGTDDRGVQAQPNVIATMPEIGATWGLVWHDSKKLYMEGAFLRRSTYYGPGGSGAIYATDPETKKSALIATVPGAGDTKHRFPRAGDTHYPFYRDSMAVWDRTSKEGLGALELTPDEKTLFTVNLNTKELVTLDVSGATVATDPTKQPAPVSPNKTVAIPNQCANADDWRPWGLGYQEKEKKVYVGGVCSGESLNNGGPPSRLAPDSAVAALKAVVLRYDPATGAFESAPAFTQSLDYDRANICTVCGGGVQQLRWNPWFPKGVNGWYGSGTAWDAYAQPILSEIEFDKSGNMILDFRDRFGDQVGLKDYGPIDQPFTSQSTVGGTGGDLRRVCLVGGAYVWDDGSNRACPGTVGQGRYSGTRRPYYLRNGRPNTKPSDGYFSDSWAYTTNHIPQGGLAYDRVSDMTVTTAVDPLTLGDGNAYTGGVRWFDNSTGLSKGTAGGGYQPYSNQLWRTVTFGKGNGMGDLALVQAREIPPTPGVLPIQIGNRVWFDTNKDGIQQPGESPLGNVHLVLWNDREEPIAEVRTNDKGQWNFWVEPNTTYKLTMDMAPEDGWTGLPAGVDPATLVFTKQFSVTAQPPLKRESSENPKFPVTSTVEFRTPASGSAVTPEQLNSLVTKGIDGRG